MDRRKWPMSTRVTNSSGVLFELLWPNDRLSWYKERLVLEAAAYNVLALHKGVLEKSIKTALNSLHSWSQKMKYWNTHPKNPVFPSFPYAKKGTKNVSFPQRFPMPRLGWNPREIPKHPVATHALAIKSFSSPRRRLRHKFDAYASHPNHLFLHYLHVEIIYSA